MTKPLKISKVVVGRDLCIGCATCTVLAPDAFQLDEECKSVVTSLEGTDAESILAAAESCPTKAIYIYDEDGKQIYPYV